jgi:hypothetical protein
VSLTGEHHVDLSGPGLTGPEAQARFEKLQAKLKPLWKSIQAMSRDL